MKGVVTMTNITTTVIVRDHGRIVMEFPGLSTADADWYLQVIQSVPGRTVNRVEKIAG